MPDSSRPQSFNRYTYSYNNPLRYTDPSGHRSCTEDQAKNDFETCDQNLGAGLDYGNVDQDELLFLRRNVQLYQDFGFFCDSMSCIDDFLNGEATRVSGGFDDFMFILGLASGGKAILEVVDIIYGCATGGPVGCAVSSLGFSGGKGNIADEVGSAMARGLCSFSADTLVATENGLKPISEVELHEQVLAYNEYTGELGYYPVVALWVHEDPIITYLTIEGETIITTPEHPFYSEEGQWVAAGELQPGDEIRGADWDTGTVRSVHFVARPQIMYNLTVATAHTFFAGNEQWLVHNNCSTFLEAGIRTTDHFFDVLDDYGIPEDVALRVYQNGKRYTNEVGGQIIYDPKLQLAIRVDNIDKGVITIWEQLNQPRSWTRGWFE